MGCDRKDSAGSPRGALAPCIPSSASEATLQGSGAVAAIERDDRAAVSERVPRCLPGNRGNKTRRAVHVGSAAFHHAHRQRPRGFTRYRRASRGAAHVPAPQASVAHMFPQHSGGTCGRRCSRRWLSNSLVTARATEAMVGVTVFWTMSVSPAQAPVQPATPTANPSHRDTGRCPGQIPALLRRFARCSSHHDAASVPVCGDS